MDIQDKQINDVTVVILKGNIDTITAPAVMEYIQSLIARGSIKIVADFDQVNYTSSAGLRVLLGTIKNTRAQNGDLRLAAVQKDVLKVLNLSGFSAILQIFTDVDSAIGSYH